MGKEPRVEDVALVWRLILGVVSREIPEWSVVSRLESRLKLSPGSVFPGSLWSTLCSHSRLSWTSSFNSSCSHLFLRSMPELLMSPGFPVILVLASWLGAWESRAWALNIDFFAKQTGTIAPPSWKNDSALKYLCFSCLGSVPSTHIAGHNQLQSQEIPCPVLTSACGSQMQANCSLVRNPFRRYDEH